MGPDLGIQDGHLDIGPRNLLDMLLRLAQVVTDQPCHGNVDFSIGEPALATSDTARGLARRRGQIKAIGSKREKERLCQ